ncbi:MAG: S8 family serine peptidase [Kofleriaceae bacterium]
MRTQTSILIAAAALAGCVVGEGEPPPGSGVATYLAAIEELAPPDVVRRAITSAGGKIDQVWPNVGILRFKATPAQSEHIIGQPYFLVVEKVSQVKDASYHRFRPALDVELGTQNTPWGISRVGGPGTPTGGRLWVFDSGVDLSNPDLVVDLEQSTDIVALLGGDQEPDTTHATAVAGVAAALDNDRDVVGVAPGAIVVSVRVLDQDGNGRTDVLIAGLEYAINRADAGDVFNLSFAGEGTSAVIETAVARVANRGVSVVLAAGNQGRDAGSFKPASTNHTGVYTVSAIDQQGCLSAFSNYGDAVDFAAPGNDILTLRPGGGMVVFDGTSFSAPHVAGLLLSGQLTGDGTTPCDDVDENPEPIAHR